MIAGILMTSLTFVALFISVVAYFLHHRRGEEALLRLGRLAFYTSVVLIFAQAILLMWGILTHHFEWIYVFSYSSKSLPLYYLIATFWAGQEGTFLLWLVFGAIYGLILIRHRRDDEALVMTFMNLVQAFIVMILVKKNPFTYVWEINPAGFRAGISPLDGNGLNPLLQDPWMTIHPPILFAGYSSTMILFAFAMSALIKRNYDNWVRPAFPYALFAGMTLGIGIILGGYWAYTTLGWGGYWGWDPVENSSLIPWLISLGLIHGMVIQRRQEGMKRSNVFLALSSFILVLYGSFLTRSGVLTDFSVHSFGESELNTYLVGFVGLFLLIAALAFIMRTREFKGQKIQSEFFSRENFMLLGILVLSILAIFTFIGTSSPLLTGLFGTASNVSINYYNSLAGPLGIILAAFIALAPLMSWKRDSRDKLKSVIVHAVLALLGGIAAFFLGIKDMIPLLILILSVFLILINGEIVWRTASKGNWNFGGYLAHAGIGFMLIGILTSSVYDRSTKVTLPLGVTTEVMGYPLQYNGKLSSPDGKDKVLIDVASKTTYAKFYWSDYSQAYMVAPSVQNMPLQDLYISPIQIIPANETMTNHQTITLQKGIPFEFEGNRLTFTGYEMGEHGMNAGDMQIAAVITFVNPGSYNEQIIKPGMRMIGQKREYIPAEFPGNGRTILLEGINVESSSISLAVSEPAGANQASAGKELLAVEVSVKPLINLLWLGTLLMFFGFLTALTNRLRKQPL